MLTLLGQRIFYGWVVAVAMALLSFASSGARFSFGVFLKPVTEEFGWDRAAFAAAAALGQVFTGIYRPLVGRLVDLYGARVVAGASVAGAGAILFLIPMATELWQMYVLFSLLSFAWSGASPVTSTPLLSAWFIKRRALALSVASLGTSTGELVTVPAVMALLLVTNWQTAYRGLALAVLFFFLPVGLLLIPNRPQDRGTHPNATTDGGEAARQQAAKEGRATLRQALATPVFWQLGLGFFVCGFTMGFAHAHFVPFATDMGFDPMVSSFALGLVGAFAMVGSLTTGALADRYGRRQLLSLTYLLRGVAFLLLLAVPSEHGEPLLFVAVFVLGISWTSTTPLTSAICADCYGRPSLGVIFGTLFSVMVIGSAAGATLDGYIYDVTKSYQVALWLSAIMGFVAAGVVYLSRPRPILARQPPAEPVAAAGVR